MCGNSQCTVDTVAVDCPDDGDYCNGAPTCEAGACVAAVPVVCDAGQECDEDANACVAAPQCTVDTVAVDCPDDGDYCNGAPTCEAGACVAAVPVDCPDGQECDETANACVTTPPSVRLIR